MPCRTSGIDRASGTSERSFAAGVFPQPRPTTHPLAQRPPAGPLPAPGDTWETNDRMQETKTKPVSISIIVCAYNEEPTVYAVLESVGKLGLADEILVLDNGSTDGTRGQINRAAQSNPRIRVLVKEKNIGLGDGLRTLVSATKGDVVVRQDADLEYSPEDLPSLIEQIENGNADVVYGSRLLVRKAHKVHYYYNYLANFVITQFSNALTNLYLSDVETEAKAFNGAIVRSIQFCSRGFEIENEMTVKLKRAGCVFYEVPVSYYGRTYEEGKKIRTVDGIRAIWATLRFSMTGRFDTKLRSLRKQLGSRRTKFIRAIP